MWRSIFYYTLLTLILLRTLFGIACFYYKLLPIVLTANHRYMKNESFSFLTRYISAVIVILPMYWLFSTHIFNRISNFKLVRKALEIINRFLIFDKILSNIVEEQFNIVHTDFIQILNFLGLIFLVCMRLTNNYPTILCCVAIFSSIYTMFKFSFTLYALNKCGEENLNPMLSRLRGKIFIYHLFLIGWIGYNRTLFMICIMLM